MLKLGVVSQSINAISIQSNIPQPQGVPPMSDNVAGYHMPTLTVFRMELQRITDMNLEIDPLITEYMKSRISEIEPTPQN